MEDSAFLRCSRASGLASGGAPNLRAALLGRSPRYTPDRSVDTIHVRLDVAIDFRRRSLSGICSTTVRSFRDAVSVVEFDAIGLARRDRRMTGGGSFVIRPSRPRS